jgi:hypothetical protein
MIANDASLVISAGNHPASTGGSGDMIGVFGVFGETNTVMAFLGSNTFAAFGNRMELPPIEYGNDETELYVLRSQDLFNLLPPFVGTGWRGGASAAGNSGNPTMVVGPSTATPGMPGGTGHATFHDPSPASGSTLLAHAVT